MINVNSYKCQCCRFKDFDFKLCAQSVLFGVVSYVLLLGATLYGTIMKPTRVQAGGEMSYHSQ